MRQTVLSSLSAIGATQEAQFYAELFAKDDPERFALILLDPRVLKNPLLEALTAALQILSNLQLSPILLIGALDGDRTAIKFQAQRLKRDLDSSGVKSTKLNTASYGLVAELKRRTAANDIPILEMTERRGPVNLPKLVSDLRPAKIVSLQPSGGIAFAGERRRNLRLSEVGPLIEDGQLSEGQAAFLRMVQRVELESSEGRRAYVLASPLNLLSELFTAKGSGTLIRKGADIRVVDHLPDNPALARSISNAFGRALNPEVMTQPIRRAFLEADYRAGAIFTTKADQVYLSKFWVVPEARGEGLARDVWEAICEDIPKFFWRSRSENPFNGWYLKMCDGMQQSGPWRVFWRGLHADDLPAIIQAAADAPIDFQ
jgi:acetylglutamate kinase